MYKKVLITVYGWTIKEWLGAYADGGSTPQALLGALVEKLRASDNPVWISVATDSQLARQLADLTARLEAAGGEISKLPLYGVPFAVKDNVDVAGWTTTAGCPGFGYQPASTAPGVQRLLDAGAIVMGKTNLDQFATGLVGTRSPYGEVRNAFNPAYVSGGSSSGSAVAVAEGSVPFSLGTDTAGSGRVPAGFNNLVGVKPTRGAVSARGVVPACRSLDCLSVFALEVCDAEYVLDLLLAEDKNDPYSRPSPVEAHSDLLPEKPRFAVPMAPHWFGDDAAEKAFQKSCQKLEALGATLVPTDFAPLLEIASLLYDGPWLAERYVAVGEAVADGVPGLDPVVAGIVTRGKQPSAADYFRAEYRRAAIKQQADALLANVDALLVPTAPTHYRIEEVRRDPVRLNSHLGTYTNFVNLLDMCALALPGVFREDGLPAGITLIAAAWRDFALLRFARRWQAEMNWTRGATGQPLPVLPSVVREPAAGYVRLAVVGAHLSGMPLNHQLTERHARFVESTTTSADYRLFALAGTVPPKPGLMKLGAGAAIQVELWDVPVAAFGSFVQMIPAPLGIGTVTLSDGREVKGFICEDWARADAQDITTFGSWRAYMASVTGNKVPAMDNRAG
ncbi:allophanate hydrolase [Alcanivorax sp. S71-1-4]|uniref:allophanate hydrolase n=1 Tax=Alcanivorax sp. S71-1-4 TaxID=1177159 RepID=UPI001F2CD6EA